MNFKFSPNPINYNNFRTISFIVLLLLLSINSKKGYFNTDIDRLKNLLSPYILIISILTIISILFITLTKNQFDFKKSFKTEDKLEIVFKTIFSPPIFICFLYFFLFSFLTDIILISNKIYTIKTEIKIFKRIKELETQNEIIISNEKYNFEKIEVTQKDKSKLLKEKDVELIFDKGIFGISFNPRIN